eukprot:1187813-Prorocentrum_minimum.AAC.9
MWRLSPSTNSVLFVRGGRVDALFTSAGEYGDVQARSSGTKESWDLPMALEFFFKPEGGRAEEEALGCGAETVRWTSTSTSSHPSPSASSSANVPATAPPSSSSTADLTKAQWKRGRSGHHKGGRLCIRAFSRVARSFSGADAERVAYGRRGGGCSLLGGACS